MNVVLGTVFGNMWGNVQAMQQQNVYSTAQNALLGLNLQTCDFVNSRTGLKCTNFPVRDKDGETCRWCRTHKYTMEKKMELEELRQLTIEYRKRTRDDDDVQLVNPKKKAKIESIPNSNRPSHKEAPLGFAGGVSRKSKDPKTHQHQPQQPQVPQLPQPRPDVVQQQQPQQQVQYGANRMEVDPDIAALLASMANPQVPSSDQPGRPQPQEPPKQAQPALAQPDSPATALAKDISNVNLNADMEKDNVYDSDDEQS